MEYFYHSIDFNQEESYSIYGKCQKCGKEVRYKIKGDVLTPEQDKTCFEERVVQFVLPVPSGKLVLADSMPHVRQIAPESSKTERVFSLESVYGRYVRTLSFLECGLLHVFVGNSSPSIIKREDEYYIANTYYPENDNGEEIDDECFGDLKLPDKIFGSVITDLWWVTAIDELLYSHLFIEKYGQDEGLALYQEAMRETLTIDIPPGDYLVTYDLKAFDEYEKGDAENPPIYASFKKIETERR